jgi:hypothetical protein
MKVWTNQPGTHNYNCDDGTHIVAEDSQYIFINGQAHDKTTLKPIFGVRFGVSNEKFPMLLSNSVFIPKDLHSMSNLEKGTNNSLYYYGLFSQNATTHNNGQTQMLGIKGTGGASESDYASCGMYESKLDSDEILSFETSWHDYHSSSWNATTTFRRRSMNYNVSNFVYGPRNSSDGHYQYMYPYHEDEKFVYGFSGNNDVGGGHTGFIAVDKTAETTFKWRGGWSYSERVNTILYKDDTTIILASSLFNDSRFAIKKFNWSDGWSHANNENVYYREDYANQDGYRSFLKWWVKADNDELEPTTSNQWHFDNNADNEIADNKIVGNPNDLDISVAPAIVHTADEDIIHPTIRRCYAPFFAHDSSQPDYYELRMTRLNIPIKGHDAFDSTDAPRYDISMCEINWDEGNTGWSSFKYDDFRGVAGQTMYRGSASKGHAWFNCAFFEDTDSNGHFRHFIMVSSDSYDGLTHYDGHNGATRALVFEIGPLQSDDKLGNGKPDPAKTDYASDNIHETDSTSLKLVQVLDLSEHCGYQIFRPEYDPKKFIAFQMREDTHPIYTWNSTAKAFITNSNFVGSNVTHMGTDSTGRFWTIQNPAKGELELHCHTIDIPAVVKITPASSSLNYSGSPITTKVNVGAFNHEGDRIGVDLKLQIRGENASFDGSSTVLEKTITVTDSADLEVDVIVSGATNLDITATHLTS